VASPILLSSFTDNCTKIPIEAGLAVVARHLYDRELSVSENRVKPASILHNSSLIMGKQIINILPEGFVLHRPRPASHMLTR
jgi:nucleoporin POM152